MLHIFRKYTCFEITLLLPRSSPYCHARAVIAKLVLLLLCSSPYCQARALLLCSCSIALFVLRLARLLHHAAYCQGEARLLPSSSSPDECCKLHPVCVNVFHHCYLVSVPIWFAWGKSECNSAFNIVTCAAKHLTIRLAIVTINVRCAISIFTRYDMVNLNSNPARNAARPTTISLRPNGGFSRGSE
jgi:hypothetical protein